MSVWGRIFAALYDPVTASAERSGLHEQRRLLLSGVSGRVLEVGGGTGANLGLYPRERIEELTITEPELPMAHRLQAKLATWPGRANLVIAPAERLPFEEDRFDFVVSTLVLCTVEDPVLALAEIRRVLKPGGRLLVLEHVRSGEPEIARWQDRLERPWQLIGHGCRCNRPTLEYIERAGFSVEQIVPDRIPKAVSIIREAIIGTAVAPLE